MCTCVDVCAYVDADSKCGDGIMSAIDFYLDVGTTIGHND